MAKESLHCWHCGASLAALPLPLGRRVECPHCASSLHVCRLCGFYDPSVSKDCREPMADEIADKEAANYCDYFRPRAGLTGSADPSAAAARAKLNALFGAQGGEAPAGKTAGDERGAHEADAEREDARRKLEELFRDGPD
jgi:hypothetical protein